MKKKEIIEIMRFTVPPSVGKCFQKILHMKNVFIILYRKTVVQTKTISIPSLSLSTLKQSFE